MAKRWTHFVGVTYSWEQVSFRKNTDDTHELKIGKDRVDITEDDYDRLEVACAYGDISVPAQIYYRRQREVDPEHYEND
jgi:hypothetical protein